MGQPTPAGGVKWFAAELANLRKAFRWAADHGDLDAAATLATYVGLLGFGVENYEPVSWAEELIEPAVAAGHARLANLYVIASLCWMAGRIEDAIRYVEIGQTVLADTLHTPPHGVEGWLGAAYLTVGQPERWAELCRTQLERRRDNHVYIRACRVFALAFAGLADEAKAHTEGLIEAGVASRNPYMHSLRSAPAAFPSVLRIPFVPCMPVGRGWRLLKTAAIVSTSRFWRSIWLGLKREKRSPSRRSTI